MTMPNFDGDDDNYDDYGGFVTMHPDDYREEDYDNVGWYGPYPHKHFGWGMSGRDEKEENLEYGWGRTIKN